MHSLVLLAFLPLAKMDLDLPILDKFKKTTPKPNCGQYVGPLSSLFQLMCNNLRSESDVMRDACVGCFRQASTSNSNQPSLSDLNNCAEAYLIGTEYDDCANLIDTATPTPAPGSCVTGYCRFVTCVRRINSDMLILECYDEALVDNDATLDFERIMLFKNITSCVLARTRCSSINPITGLQQTNTITTTSHGKWGIPQTNTIQLYNSLQITPDGDLRIVQLPGTTKIRNYFCTAQPNLRESSWLEYSC